MKGPALKYLWCGALIASSALAQSTVYRQVNLVSDVPGLAGFRDVNLVNAWGIAFGGTGPWWVNANGTGIANLYDGSGLANPLKVSIPPPENSSPTGIVFNGTTDFPLIPGQRAVFLFASENGTISGWNPAVDATNAVIKVSTPNAVYKGLTLGQLANGQNVLYAADLVGGRVDQFDGNFNPRPFDPAAFQDPTIPAGFAPFNVQNIGGSIFVAFAKQGTGNDEVHGPGLGFVVQFTPEGRFVRRLENGPWMNAPWGMVAAPSNFGTLSNKLLVGQFGGGQIATFNPVTGAFEGLMLGENLAPIQIDGLWGIRFGNDAGAGSSRELFFAAGINDEADGLFGKLFPGSPIIVR